MRLFVFLAIAVLAFAAVSDAANCQAGAGKARGVSYRGKVNITKGGHRCQMWSSQKPHRHPRKGPKYKGFGLGKHNFCRNPTRSKVGLWCYTTNPKKRWDACGVPNCGARGCLKGSGKKRGASYRGKVSYTKSGRKCQKWTSQKPHKHTRTPGKRKGRGLGAHNFCRNPTDDHAGVWCYTVDRRKRWEPCAIPSCKARSSRGGGSVCHVHCGSQRYIF